MSTRWLKILSVLFFALWITIVFAYPLTKMAPVLEGGGLFSASSWEIVRDRWMGPVGLAMTASVVSLLVGAVLLVLFPWIASSRLDHAFSSLFLLPTPLILAIFLGLGRWMNLGFGFWWVVTAQVFLNAPYLGRELWRSKLSLPANEIEVAQTLGAGRMAVMFKWIAPHFLRRTLPSLAQVFLWCLGSFALVLILGGGPPVDSLQTETYAALKAGPDYWPLAFTWMVAEWGVALVVILAAIRSGKAQEGSVVRTYPKNRIGDALGILLFVFPLVLLCADFFQGSFSFVETASFWSGPGLQATANSWILGVSVALLTLVGATLVLFAIHSYPSLRFFFWVFAAAPMTALYFLFWASTEFESELSYPLLFVIGVSATFLLPSAVRFLVPYSLRVNRSAYEAALTFGASPIRAFIAAEKRALARAAKLWCALAFLAGFAESQVSLFMSRSQLLTLPIYCMRLQSQYRFSEAAVGILVLFFAWCSVNWLLRRSEEVSS